MSDQPQQQPPRDYHGPSAKLRNFEYYRGYNEREEFCKLQVLFFLSTVLILIYFHIKIQAMGSVLLEISDNKLETEIESVEASGDNLSIESWLQDNPQDRHHDTFPSPDISPYSGDLFDIRATDEREVGSDESGEGDKENNSPPLPNYESPVAVPIAEGQDQSVFTTCTLHDLQEAEICGECFDAIQSVGTIVPASQLPTFSVAHAADDPAWTDVDHKDGEVEPYDLDYETVFRNERPSRERKYSSDLCQIASPKRVCLLRRGQQSPSSIEVNKSEDSSEDSTIDLNQ